MITIRLEEPADVAGIRLVNELAFGQPGEARLVDALRDHGAAALSLVALDGGKIVGHILFSPVEISGEGAPPPGIGLAPMAVLPECQRQGIGSQLVVRGLDLLKAGDHPYVVVLGHPGYYPRFGFTPASRLGLSCTYDVPDEMFMAMELHEGALSNTSGVVKYREEFDSV